MSDPISFLLISLAGLVVISAFALFVLKGVRRGSRRRSQKRQQRFVDLVGELIIRGEYQVRSFGRHSKDPIFRGVVLEYLRMLQGADRDKLVIAARDMGLVAHYLSELRSNSKDDRVTAVEALGEIADPTTLEDLVFTLNDPISEVRVQAASALAIIGNPAAVKSLLAAMDHEDEWNAQRIADSLFTFGREAVPEMNKYLQGTGKYRPLVARTLGLVGDVRAEMSLVQALSSTDMELRMRSAAALGKAGTPQSVRYLLDAMGDERWEVRAQVATALGRRRDHEAVPWLKKAMGDEAWWVRHNSASALAEIPGGIEALRATLDHRDPYSRDAASAVLLSCGAASEAVKKLKDPAESVRRDAQSMIQKLIHGGKSEFFLAAGLNPAYVEALQVRPLA